MFMNKKWKLISYVLAGALFLGVSGTTLTGCKDYDDDIDSLNARVDEVAKSASEALDSKVKALETQITTLTTAKDQLAKDLDAAKVDADKKVAEAKQAAAGAQETADKAFRNAEDALAKVATLESQINLVNETLDSLKDEIAGVKGQYEGLKSEVDGVKELVDKNAANAIEEFLKVNEKIDGVKAELLAALNVLETSLNGISGDVATLRQEFNAANGAIGQNTADIDGLKEQFLTLQKGLETQQDALEAYKLEVIEKLGDKVDNATLETKIDEVNSSINDLKEEVDGLAAQWQADIDEAISTYVTSKDFASKSDLKSAVDGLESTINQKLTGYVTTANLDAYLGKEGSITKDISSINSKLTTLSSLFSKRLTAMIFAPTTYVDGIEVIQFATLKYTNWVNLQGDKADGKLSITINNGATKAEYYVSPSNVAKASVKELKILLNNATNIHSKAAAPLEISDYDILADGSGKMVVSLKKTTTDAFAGKGDQFQVMALQATIEPTAEEAEAGIAPVVTSDWARIYETSVVPYIHNTDTKTCDVDDVDGTTGKDSKFYSYKEIHSAGGSLVADKGICDTDGKYIVRSLVYDAAEPFDLNTLVTVCDKDGNFYKAADYGLKFEFELVENYWLKASKEEATNQQNFAKIDNGKITSQSNNGQPNNADAVGREPMIRVTLIDEAHNNNVVDVRYFKIKWIAKPNKLNLGEIEAFKDMFECSKEYPKFVGTEKMNDMVYAKVDIAKEMFHTLYNLDANIYADEAKAMAGTPAASDLGKIEEILAPGSTVTHNLQWTYTVGTITEAEYNAGEAVRTVYGRYIHKGNDADIIVFSLKLTLEIKKMAVSGYNGPVWNVAPTPENADKQYQVNPALIDDEIYGNKLFKDCQIITSLLNGYLDKAGATPANVLTAVLNADKAAFSFDKDRLAMLGAGWTVSEDGTTLSKGGMIAARIEGGNIRLEENPLPTLDEHGVPTNAAQLLLGKNVPVKLVAENCAGIVRTVDQFLVNFIDPLKMTVNQKETNLYDLETPGSTISIEKAVTLMEAFGKKNPIIYLEGDELKTNDDLMEWYHVGAVTWDIDNAKTNLKMQNGSIVITDKCDNNWSDFMSKYNLSVEDEGKTLKFVNKSGTHLQRAFKVQIPVSLETKWKPNLTDPEEEAVTVTINPGQTN